MNDPQLSSPSPCVPSSVGWTGGASLLRHYDIGATVTTRYGRGLVVLGPVLTPPPTTTGPTGPGTDAVERPDRHSRTPAADWMHVYVEDAGLTTREADELVVPLDDLALKAALLSDALAALAYHHDQTLTAERDRTARQHAHLLRIRQVLIDSYRDGYLPADQLGDLLARAGLAAYRPRLRVAFTLTGSYDVPGSVEDIPDVRRRATRLLVDLSDIDDHVGTTPDLTVHVDDVTPIDH